MARIDRLIAEPGPPKLLTVRSRQQGGEAPAAEREALLRRAVAGADFVDLEAGGPDLALLKVPGKAGRIVSWHDPASTPADLGEIAARVRAEAGGALVKIVTQADAAGDNLRVRDLLQGSAPGSLIAFCMGPRGIPSRVLAPAWGSAAIYAPAREAMATAPGQVPIEDLFDLYGIDRIGPRTRLFGVLAHPVGHSLSPRLHNAAFRALAIDACYLPFEARTVAEFLPLIRDLRIAGLSVTLPHKEAIVPHLDRLDDTARAIGAVNTVVKTWDRLEGHNTDVEAAIAPLRPLLPLRGARVAILGAGGAARAIAWGLKREVAEVVLFNRTPGRATALAADLGVGALPWGRLRRHRCDLLINATPVGMTPDIAATPVPAGWCPAPVVYDIVYNPPVTRFLREAAERGARAIGGVEMFVGQAEAQFRLFAAQDPPPGLMRATLLEALGAPPPARRPPTTPKRRPR
jgi:3-dehydroquinate dehydratase/shikimate dehydrogenase